ncbi:MAG TPA: hypothetical protein VN524_11590 [Hyphomicrobiaceae bacterium]|jgi:hypothetical protein|nr:hypothetical protein [Hyphomicrobiaceae bacterium]
MRTLLASSIAPKLIAPALIAGIGFTALSAATSSADAARKYRRAPVPSYSYAPPNYYAPPPAISQRQVCEERAQAADPTGLYAGYPCWAREAFGRGGAGGRGR